MQEKILALYDLQKIDSQIDSINKVKGELPLEVQDLDDELAGLKARVENINAEIEELNALSKQRKREVDQAKILIGNYKEQQNNVRNNREFDAITKEIEYQELEIELAEKRLKEYAAGIKVKKAQGGTPEGSRSQTGRVAKYRGRDGFAGGGIYGPGGQSAGQDRRTAAGGLSANPSQRTQRTRSGDGTTRCVRRMLQPDPAAAPDGDPSGQEDHHLRILRSYSGGRSRRAAIASVWG